MPGRGGGLAVILLHDPQPVYPARVHLAVEAFDHEHFLLAELGDFAVRHGDAEGGEEARAHPFVLHGGTHVGLAIAHEAER